MSTMRVEPGLVASKTPPCVSKNDCSTETYIAMRVRVIIHSPPNVGAEMFSAVAPNIETPPFAPQYHESVKERAFCGAACAAAMAGRRAAQASPAVNVRIVRIAQPQMTRVEVSAVNLAQMCRKSRSRRSDLRRLPRFHVRDEASRGGVTSLCSSVTHRTGEPGNVRPRTDTCDW